MAETKEAPKKTNGERGQTTEVARGVARPVPASTRGSWERTPFDLMRRFGEEMDHLFEGFFGPGFGSQWPGFMSRSPELRRHHEGGMTAGVWSPRVDVLQRDGNVLYRVDLPGLTKDDVKVDVTDDTLTIQGERKHETQEEHEGYFYSERTHGKFYRAIPLPESADASKANAEFHNGVLEVSVPAPALQEQKARRLEIKESK
jgi:HSP20 family protein